MTKKLILIVPMLFLINLFGSESIILHSKKRNRDERALALKNYNTIFVDSDNHKFDKVSQKIQQLPESDFKEFSTQCVIKKYKKSCLRKYEKLEKEIKRVKPLTRENFHILEHILELTDKVSHKKARNRHELLLKNVQIPWIQKNLELIIAFFYNNK